MVQQKITIDADNSKAKQSIAELKDLFKEVQKDIDRVNKASRANNNTLSDKQVAGVQNDFADIRAGIETLQELVESERRNGGSGDLERSYGPMIQNALRSLEVLTKSNSNKLQQINNSRTTSSSAFKDPAFNDINLDTKVQIRAVRSEVKNITSSLNKVIHSFDIAKNAGPISYNRMQEFYSSSNNASTRIDQMLTQFTLAKNGGDRDSIYNKTIDRYRKLRNDSRELDAKVGRGEATREEINHSKELHKQVEELHKSVVTLEEFRKELNIAKDKYNELNAGLKADDVQVSRDPNSFLGQLEKRQYSIIRGAIASGMLGVAGAVSQGDSLRLGAFDDIKGIAYAQGGRHADDKALKSLRKFGVDYGYNMAEMAGFANAYSASTGNTGSYRGVAKAWARQSRVTGGNAESTQNLERSAGDATSMSGSQMARLGDQVTNAITSSGMTSKATEQQQGLAQLFQNASTYGATSKNLQDLTGLQASLSKYGAQFQGTAGANTITQAMGVLGNFNDLQARTMFVAGQGSKYAGVTGQAKLMEDMQNINKDPASMKRVIDNYMKYANGNELVAAAALSSKNPNVSVDTWKKLIKASENGDLDKKTMEKYLKDDSKAKDNDKTYQKSGAATVQKYNTALANSAMKASRALDSFKGAITKIANHTGGLSTFIGGALGGALGQLAPNLLGSLFSNGRGGRLLAKGGNAISKSGAFLKNSKWGSRAIKAGGSLLDKAKSGYLHYAYNRQLRKATPYATRDMWGATKEAGRFSKLKNYGKGILGRFGKKAGAEALEEEATKAGGKLGAKLIPGLGNLISGGFAINDLAHGRIGNALLNLGGMIPGIGYLFDGASMLGVGDKLDSFFKHPIKGMKGLAKSGKLGKLAKKGGALGLAGLGAIGTGKWLFGKLTGKGAKAKKLNNMHLKSDKVYLSGTISIPGGATGSAKGSSKNKNRHKNSNKNSWVIGLAGLPSSNDGTGLGALSITDSGKLGKLIKKHAKDKKGRSKGSKFHNDDDWSILKAYNKMLGKAKTIVDEAKSISLNGDGSGDDSSDGEKDGGTASGEGDEALRSVAKKLGKELDVDPSFIYGQMMHETGGKFDHLAGKNNYSGMTYVGQSGAHRGKHQPDGPGYYADFDTLDDYANAYGATLKADHVQGSKTVEDYVKRLKAGNYFSGDLGTYINAVKKFASQYANGGIRSFASGSGFITSQPTMVNNRDLFAEAGTEAFIPLNTSHSGAGMSALNDLAGVFGKKLVSPGEVQGQVGNTTVNPSYNINLTIQGGTDNPQALADTVAKKVREVISQYETQLNTRNTLNFYANETRGSLV